MSDSSPRAARIGVALFALIAVALSGWHYWTVLSSAGPSTFDDSYMFVRYAKHIIAGHGHAWNPDGVQTYGITSLLYVFVITLLRWATELSDADLVRVTASALGVIGIAVMVLTAGRFSKTPGLRGNYALWAGLLVPATLLSGPFVYHSLTGMDTLLAVCMHALLVFVTFRMVERGTARALWPVVLVGYLAFLTRPDSAIYAAFFPALALWFLTDPARRLHLIVTFWVSLGVVLAIDAGIKYLVFGVPVPLPTYAKMHGHYTEYAGLWMWNPVEYLLEFLACVLPFLAVIVAFVRRRTAPLLLVFAIPAALTLASYFNIVQIMGYRARFSFPTMPFVVMAAAFVLDRGVGAWKEAPERVGAVVGARALLAISLFALMPVARTVLPPIAKEELVAKAPKAVPVQNPGGLRELSYWQSVAGMIQLGQRAPAGAVYAMSEYGCVGAAAPELTIYDPLGLHDIQTAREGFSAAVLFEREPDLLWLPHPDYVAMRREILGADALWSDYAYYPAAFRFGVAVRTKGPRAEEMQALFAEVWAKYYPQAPMEAHRLER